MLSTLQSLPTSLWTLLPPPMIVEGEPAPPGIMQFLPMILIGVLAWFLLIAPERRRQKERQAMLNAIKKNDSVVTVGGLLGVVTKVDELQVTLRIAEGVHVQVQRASIANILRTDSAANE